MKSSIYTVWDGGGVVEQRRYQGNFVIYWGLEGRGNHNRFAIITKQNYTTDI